MADKGGNFEREMCRAISLWWTKGERDDVLWRNRVRRTSRMKKAEMQEGDIGATDSVAIPLMEILSIECKSGYSIRKKPGKNSKVANVPWDLLDLIDGTGKRDNSVILKFWDQTRKAAEMTNRYPMLIFKRDFHKPVICIDSKLEYELEERYFKGYLRVMASICVTVEGHDTLVFFDMDEFFHTIPPEAILSLKNQRRKRA